MGGGGDAANDLAWVRSRSDLGSLLRQLRRREARRRGARELSYRDLAARTGWSHAIIGQYMTGAVVPPTDRFDVLIRMLGAGPAEQHVLATARDRIEDQRRAPAARAGVRTRPDPPGPPSVVPRQLPLAARHFTGREAELAMLGELADQAARAEGTVLTVVIDGTAGIGKTTLAVHAAHRMAGRFPDGQLYVDLQGFDPAGSPVDPSEAVRCFLDALEVPAARVPASRDAQAALYRSILAGRRMLVLLDNARDASQVRPLLPGTPGCLVIATSRNRLTGLIRAEHAQPLTLGLLTAAESHKLLAGRLGAGRVTAELTATQAIVAQCAGLPLALSIFAARAAAQPRFPLAALVAGLHRPSDPDPDSDIRAVFSWSYCHLPGRAAQVFRLLGLHPGHAIGIAAASALTGDGTASVTTALADLATAHLVDEQAPGRFACHDLLRAYALDLAIEHETEEGRHACLRRMHDYYLQTAFAAAMRLDPLRDPVTLPSPLPGVHPDEFADRKQALAWFRAEHDALLACIRLAHRDQRHAYTWHLAWTLADYLDRRGHWHAWADTHKTALEAARHLGDSRAEAYAHRGIGRAFDRVGRYNDAQEHLRDALRLYEELGDRTGQAHALLNLAGLYERQGRYAESLASAEQALPLFRDAGHETGQANSLNVIGWCQARLGNHGLALTYCEEALALHHKSGDLLGTANTFDSLGYAHHNLGGYEAASASYRSALDLFREMGDRYYEAVALTHIGDTELAAGNAPAARDAWLWALSILEPLDRTETDQAATRCDCPDAALVRAKLRESGAGSLGPGPGAGTTVD